MYRLLIIAIVAASLSGCATHLMTSGQVVVKDDNYVVKVSFSDRDREVIRDYYQKLGKRTHKKTPPGLAKRGNELPPGLVKRDVLPPGLQGRALPSALESRLTPLSDPYVRVRIGADIVLLDRNTRVIVDVVYNVAV